MSAFGDNTVKMRRGSIVELPRHLKMKRPLSGQLRHVGWNRKGERIHRSPSDYPKTFGRAERKTLVVTGIEVLKKDLVQYKTVFEKVEIDGKTGVLPHLERTVLPAGSKVFTYYETPLEDGVRLTRARRVFDRMKRTVEKSIGNATSLLRSMKRTAQKELRNEDLAGDMVEVFAKKHGISTKDAVKEYRRDEMRKRGYWDASGEYHELLEFSQDDMDNIDYEDDGCGQKLPKFSPGE
jgi:hypothetical protein